MDISILTDEQMNLIIDNFGRSCPECKQRMQPLSTRCVRCGVDTTFVKVFKDHYIEHFEITKCKEHENSFHFCSHPKSTSKLEELQVFCIKCIITDRVKKDVIIKTHKPESI